MIRKQPTHGPVHRKITRRAFAKGLPASLLLGQDRVSARQTSQATPVGAATPIATPDLPIPTLHILPTTLRFDERFDVWLSGLQAGQEVTLTSAFFDYGGTQWKADTTFVADDTGYLDLARQAPIDGTYAVPDTMALIWSARAYGYYSPPMLGAEEVVITATVDGEVIGEETVERSALPVDRRPRYIYEETMVANYYEPDSGASGDVPAVIVLGGSDGGLSPYTDFIAAMLASRGFATLALAYFGIGHLPPGLSRIPLEYFGDAIAWLQGQPGIDRERIGVVGVSRGAELALLLGTIYPELKAVVSFVGSGYVHAEYIGSASDVTAAAWTWQDEPVRHLDAYEMTEEELRESEIEVERINGPILLIGADDDRVWPSSNLSGVAWERLQREGHSCAINFSATPVLVTESQCLRTCPSLPSCPPSSAATR